MKRTPAALGILLLAFALTHGTGTQAVSNDASGNRRPQQRQTPIQSNAQPVLPASVQDAIQRIAGALEAANQKLPSSEEKDQAARNLAAQEKIARWAPYVFFAALGEFLVTAAGVFLVWKTLEATQRAATAAENTLGELQKNAALELRAYLSVEPLGIRLLSGSNNCLGQVSVRNVGKVPAKNVVVFVHMRFSDQRDTKFDVPKDPDNVLRAIQPGATMTQGSVDYLLLQDIMTANKKYVFVFGAVYYENGFNDIRRHTRFCHRYATASFDRTQWAKEGSATHIVIEASKARYHTHCNEAI